MKAPYYLGCDVSLRSGGYAIVGVENRQPFLVKKITIKTDSKMSDGQALAHIAQELMGFIEGYPLEAVIREKAFTRFHTSTQQIFKTLGVVHYLLAEHAIDEIAPTTIKKEIGGHGKAEKTDVISGVCRLLALPPSAFILPPKTAKGKPRILDDESDACAAVLVYLQQKGLIEK